MPLEWHEGGLKYEISKLQLKSMIGGDSYVFNAEKSIAKCFRTFFTLPSVVFGHFCATCLACDSRKNSKILKFQSNSMLGVDSYFFLC